MTQHDDPTSMRHMLDYAVEAVEMLHGRSRVDLERNRMLQLALVRLVEIVGEAATRVSDESRNRYPTVPWRQARVMRNRLIHGYDTIDLGILWDTIEHDLPPLIAELRRVLGEEPDQP